MRRGQLVVSEQLTNILVAIVVNISVCDGLKESLERFQPSGPELLIVIIVNDSLQKKTKTMNYLIK